MKGKTFYFKTAFLIAGFLVFGTIGVRVTAHNDDRAGAWRATPTPKITPTPKLSPTPKPSATPTPTPTPVWVQTLADLQSRIRLRLSRPELRRGQIGIKIVSLNSSKVVFEENAEKYFMPASNMKNFTVATALERLGPDFRFVTSVFANGLPDANGTVKGDLRIFGRGDISISTAFNNGDYYKGLDDLADKIAQAGVKRVEGNLIGDESYFRGNAIPGSWEWDDLQWYYGAEISALPLNDNAVDVAVTPGMVGALCNVTVSPANKLMVVNNRCFTTRASEKRQLQVVKKLDRNILDIIGTVPVGDNGFKGSVTFTHPADLFITLLKQRLELKGVTITGNARLLHPDIKGDPSQVEIAKLESPPFSLIAAKTMKPSQNMYTETLLWTLGEQSRYGSATSPGNGSTVSTAPTSNADSSEIGILAVKKFLFEIGVAPDGIIQYDGSGLSRHNLITPAAVVRLYTYMARQSKYSTAWRDSLTIGGVDGTLANRFKGTAAAGNIRGKTGTIDQVSALSGYLTTASGEQLVLSIVVNGVAEPRMRTGLIDEIVLNLANFNGKVE